MFGLGFEWWILYLLFIGSVVLIVNLLNQQIETTHRIGKVRTENSLEFLELQRLVSDVKDIFEANKKTSDEILTTLSDIRYLLKK